jgi:hypothetical protein
LTLNLISNFDVVHTKITKKERKKKKEMPKIGQEAIGTHVEVYWEDQEEWYQGYIKAYDTVKGYFVQYEDGDEQWERVCILLPYFYFYDTKVM